MEIVNFLLSVWVKFFFLFTPFFALTMFLTYTKDCTNAQRNHLSVRTTLSVLIVCIILLFFGNIIFAIFGITLDAFRVGAGVLLFLSAVKLVQGAPPSTDSDPNEDVAVVPLAIPIVVGPATIGALLVFGSEISGSQQKVAGFIALLLAVISLMVILMLGTLIERAIGQRGINILSKITGLILAALSAQMVMTGIKSFFA